MKKFFISILLFLSFYLFSNNDKIVGNLELNNNSITVIARENGTISLNYGINLINLKGQSINLFKQYSNIAIELMNKVESDNITIKYKRCLGQLISSNNKKIMIYFSSKGTGYSGCKLIFTISSIIRYESETKLVFSGDQIKELLNFFNKGSIVLKKNLVQIAMLNTIAQKAIGIN